MQVELTGTKPQLNTTKRKPCAYLLGYDVYLTVYYRDMQPKKTFS